MNFNQVQTEKYQESKLQEYKWLLEILDSDLYYEKYQINTEYKNERQKKNKGSQAQEDNTCKKNKKLNIKMQEKNQAQLKNSEIFEEEEISDNNIPDNQEVENNNGKSKSYYCHFKVAMRELLKQMEKYIGFQLYQHQNNPTLKQTCNLLGFDETILEQIDTLQRDANITWSKIASFQDSFIKKIRPNFKNEHIQEILALAFVNMNQMRKTHSGNKTCQQDYIVYIVYKYYETVNTSQNSQFYGEQDFKVWRKAIENYFRGEQFSLSEKFNENQIKEYEQLHLNIRKLNLKKDDMTKILNQLKKNEEDLKNQQQSQGIELQKQINNLGQQNVFYNLVFTNFDSITKIIQEYQAQYGFVDPFEKNKTYQEQKNQQEELKNQENNYDGNAGEQQQNTKDLSFKELSKRSSTC